MCDRKDRYGPTQRNEHVHHTKEAKRKCAASEEGAAIREGKGGGGGEANVWRADD